MGTRTEYDIPIGRYTSETGDDAEDTICLACASIHGRYDIFPDYAITYGGYPDGFTCAECGHVVPCHPDLCTCELQNIHLSYITDKEKN